MGKIIAFPGRRRRSRHHGEGSNCGDPSISINRLSETSGKAISISGHASRGKRLRCFQARTAPDFRPTFAANADGPPFSSINSEGVRISMQKSLPKVTTSGKAKVTQGNVTVGNVCWMATDEDNSWRHLKEGNERLRWARLRWQKKNKDGRHSATDAADTLGMKAGTYRTYERPEGASKHTPLNHRAAIQFGRLYRVNWIWLLTGEGSPFDDVLPAQIDRVVRTMEEMTEAQQKSIADMIEALHPPGQSEERKRGLG